jgi:hypothetical protein
MTFRQILDEFYAKRVAFPRGIGISELANLLRVEFERLTHYRDVYGIRFETAFKCWLAGFSVEHVLHHVRKTQAEREAML